MQEYIGLTANKSNKGWHDQWVYLKSEGWKRFPRFTGRYFIKAPQKWHSLPSASDQAQIQPLIRAIGILKSHGLRGAGVVGHYHERRLAPLMQHRLQMWEMDDDAESAGTHLSPDPLTPEEIGRRISKALEKYHEGWPLAGHPPMRPSAGFIGLLSVCRSRPMLPEIRERVRRREERRRVHRSERAAQRTRREARKVQCRRDDTEYEESTDVSSPVDSSSDEESDGWGPTIAAEMGSSSGATAASEAADPTGGGAVDWDEVEEEAEAEE
ncbi:unnamed protein product [Urochloa humidicola]